MRSSIASARPTNPMRLGRRMKPTQKHRPAIWECLLGTVYAMNADREVQYFDYNWDAAMEFAGVTDESDLRTYRKRERVSYSRHGSLLDEPRFGQLVLWMVDR